MASETSNAEALDYYNKCPKIKAQALRFFNSMDRNGDGTISKKEFSCFVKRSKFLSKWIEHDTMFSDLDQDNNGQLDYDEFITFVHKVFTFSVCDVCGQAFDQGKPRLTCAKCFSKGRRPFDLCTSCHSEKKYKHKHKDFQDFGELVCQYESRMEKVSYFHFDQCEFEMYQIGNGCLDKEFLCNIQFKDHAETASAVVELVTIGSTLGVAAAGAAAGAAAAAATATATATTCAIM